LTTETPNKPDWLTIVKPSTLKEPTGVAVSRGRIIVADHSTNNVLCLDRAGAITKQLSVTEDVGPLNSPHGLLALETKIMVADTLKHRVVELDLDLRTIRANNEFAGKRLRRPHGFASNTPNEHFLADTDNNRILRVFSGKGEDNDSACELPLESLDAPCGLGISPRHLFIADT
jgi:hypothetical protein